MTYDPNSEHATQAHKRMQKAMIENLQAGKDGKVLPLEVWVAHAYLAIKNTVYLEDPNRTEDEQNALEMLLTFAPSEVMHAAAKEINPALYALLSMTGDNPMNPN